MGKSKYKKLIVDRKEKYKVLLKKN